MTTADGGTSEPGGLDLRRAVQVITEREAGAGRLGSGYRVTRDKVLTAAHVVRDAKSVQVRFLTEDGQTTEVPGESIWLDPAADIALLRIASDTSIGGLRAAEVAPVRFGRVTKAVECETLGFPRFKLRTDSAPLDRDAPTAYRDSHHALGSVTPWADLRRHRLEINVAPPEYDRERGRSPWEGMSGAAVWSGGCVIGVVSEHHRSDGLGRLAASRVDHWHQLLAAAQIKELNELISLPTDADQLERLPLPPPPPPPRSKTTIVLDDAAEQLAQALREQWSTEAERQRLRAPDLVVRWELSSARLRDQWRIINLSGEDDRPLDLAGQLSEIANVYERVPSRRLVVLGRAGSGKSVLAMRFVLDLLRLPGTPVGVVPVIFSLGSWNPATPLRDWLTSQLERAHPGLAEPGPGTSTLAAALVHNGRILPVLDGFDEIAGGLQGSALEKLNDTATSGTPMPVMLTSRIDEYADAVQESGALKAAAGIQMADLSMDDVETYLRLTTGRTRSASEGTGTDEVNVWSPVLTALNDPKHSAGALLATVLSTPLMVALARTIYSNPSDRDPLELLDTDKFSTPEALEDHLLRNFVPAAYRDKPHDYLERAQDWLGHLAEHLNQLDTTDLKWWRLGSTLRLPVRTLVVGLVVGLFFGLANGLANWCLDPGFVWRWLEFVHVANFTLVSGLAFGLAHGIVDRGAAREPSRVRIRILSRTRKQRKTYVPRLVAGFVGGFAFGFVTLLVNALASGLQAGVTPVSTRLPTLGRQPSLLDGLAVGLASGLALGLAYAGRASAPSRVRLRIADEMREFCKRLVPRMAIGYAGGFGVGFALVLVASTVIGFVYGFAGGFMTFLVNVLKSGLEFGRVYGLVGGLAYGLIVALEEPIPISSAVSPSDLLKINRRTVVSYWLVCGLTCGLAGWIYYGLDGRLSDWLNFALVGGLGGGLAYGLSLTAWGHWVAFSRIWLPLTGRLPRDMSAFLEDAHRRGVLRQAGTVYQFRHARLRNHLADAFRNPR